MTEIIDEDGVAADIRDGLRDPIGTLAVGTGPPTLATVLMSPDPASETYVSMKQRDCAAVDVDLP